ncbi:MAG: hypothetical protein PUF12_11760 [Thermoflexaceae bacterium]|nr:hypothetical protein [Thermoflexaceae bacterium]
MATEYYFNRKNLEWAQQTQKKAGEKMEEAYEKMLEIYKVIKESTAWSGKSKETFLIFINLVMQYHGALIHRQLEEGKKLKTSCNFMEEAEKAVERCLNNMEQFPADSVSVQGMENVQ